MAFRLVPRECWQRIKSDCSMLRPRMRTAKKRGFHGSTGRLKGSTVDEDIDDMLSKPTWSVKSLLPTETQIDETAEVSTQQLHHLLRLCALPEPHNAEEESKMLRGLKAQLHFVKEIQRVNTTGVLPLRSIRDESEAAQSESAISVETLREALNREEIVGKHFKRIRVRRDAPPLDRTAEDWDVLGQAPKKAGRYFKVEVAEQ